MKLSGRGSPHHKLTPQQREEMVERYLQGEAANDLATIYGVDRKTVFYHIHRRGHKTRPLHPSSFFKTWTPNMSYVLGLWFADGCMHPTSHCISLASKDDGYMHLIANLIGEPCSLFQRKKGAWQLAIGSKEMYHDLSALGGTPRKSLTIQWPYVPDDLIPHFIRGYIDGDGCLLWDKWANGASPALTACGTEHFLTGMARAIEKATGIPKPRIRCTGKIHVVWWYGLQAKCLAIWLYLLNKGPSLARKESLAQEFATWWPKQVKWKKISPEMRIYFSQHLPS